MVGPERSSRLYKTSVKRKTMEGLMTFHEIL